MPDTAIEWTDAVWNPVVGCSRVSEGCRNCYAERFAHRGMSEQHRGLTQLSSRGPQWTGEVRFLPEKLGEPLRWKKPRRVFVNSMSDLFHDKLSNEEIAAVFGVMAACPEHTFQVLTKRPRRMLEWFGSMAKLTEAAAICACIARDAIGPLHVSKAVAFDRVQYGSAGQWPLPNVWLGVSAEDQRAADERIPLLLQAPAAVRFVSAEPLLGPIDFGLNLGLRLADGEMWSGSLPLLDWVIVGGETGPGARECDMAWVRSIVRQCRAHDVACFVKQLGAKPVGWARNGRPPVLGGQLETWPEDLQVRQFPEVRHG